MLNLTNGVEEKKSFQLLQREKEKKKSTSCKKKTWDNIMSKVPRSSSREEFQLIIFDPGLNVFPAYDYIIYS